jgi:N6-L-threonylcarbamoyladenine synthase
LITLGIETSCDDTSICILESNEKSLPKILSHNSFSSEKILQKWGGVVPEVAARNHLDKITPLLSLCLEEASLSMESIDLIGVTTNPGLLGPLLTGLNAAKTISLMKKKPIVPVNHLFAHLEAIHLTKDITYPYLGLLFSGGHSLFCEVTSSTDFKVISSTIDDAAGEAFDKGGKLMGLNYPAGKEIDNKSKNGNTSTFSFPIGLKNSKDGRLSFSGVKSSLRRLIELRPEILNDEKLLSDLCASYQESIVEAIKLKTKEVLNLTTLPKNTPIVLGGGVACNSRLREVLDENFKNLFIVEPKFCTDNGAMVANYAARTFKNSVPFPDCLKIDARNRFIKKGDLKNGK